MDGEILVALDKVHDNLRMVPSFNAIHWRPEYIDMAFPRYPTPEARTLMQEYQEFVMNNKLEHLSKHSIRLMLINKFLKNLDISLVPKYSNLQNHIK
jgi:glutaredoxin 2